MENLIELITILSLNKEEYGYEMLENLGNNTIIISGGHINEVVNEFSYLFDEVDYEWETENSLIIYK